MKFATGISQLNKPDQAVLQIREQLPSEQPSSIICYYSQEFEPNHLQSELKSAFPDTPIVACSTCRGVFSDKGVHFGTVVGVMAIYDDAASSYTTLVAQIPTKQQTRQSIHAALDSALEQVDRIGELPSFILCHPTPGLEESVVSAIDDYFISPVPIVGGSASDNRVWGLWSLFDESQCSQSGVALMLFYTKTKCTHSFSSGYSKTPFSGVVTKSCGREIFEIDGEPAEQVYRRWIAEYASVDVPLHFEFDLVTKYSLGRKVGELFDHSYYKLSHPIRVSNQEGAILLFTDIQEGDRVTMMDGNQDEMILRPARVLQDASIGNTPQGAIFVICAGPMMYLKEDIRQVYHHIVDALGSTPFLSPFTFGEQGRFIGGEIAHANLMVTSAVFHQ
ncbi:FIST signal transduction protein [Vibrio sp. WXL210]|uniref:FIST signal transduction protein n=1 Tax=Vibrio sp. WXL210 TaxID=3450709 RepID=UPI003EC4F1E0